MKKYPKEKIEEFLKIAKDKLEKELEEKIINNLLNTLRYQEELSSLSKNQDDVIKNYLKDFTED